uniref:C2H2-type domain-containing protein n=1 Tax=Meloidogyne enterolobii TaxID=390850 RepID=A0A6V7Y0D7_MELEN|nr:unnamed protein product [Meloidogyne enterolobii]
MKLSIFLFLCLFLTPHLVHSNNSDDETDEHNYFNPFQPRNVGTSETGTTGQGGTGTGSIPSNTEGYTQEVNSSGLEAFQPLSNLNQALGSHPFLFSPQHRQINVEQVLMENQGSNSYFAKCEWNGCGSVFYNQNEFVEHVKDHTKDQKHKYRYCNWTGCNGRLMLYQNFAKHIRKHTGERPYVCKYVDQNGVICNKEFTRQENFKTHQNKHKGEIIIHTCAHCDRTFTSLRGKNKHEKRKHGAGSSNADNESVIGHSTNLHEGDYPQYIPEGGQQNFDHHAYQAGGHQPFDYSAYTHQGGQQNFGYPAYTLHEWQQHFGHPAYQSGGQKHYDYSAYLSQGGQQNFTQLPTNLGHQGQHFIHTTHPIHGDGTGSGNEGNDSQVCMKVQTWSLKL